MIFCVKGVEKTIIAYQGACLLVWGLQKSFKIGIFKDNVFLLLMIIYMIANQIVNINTFLE